MACEPDDLVRSFGDDRRRKGTFFVPCAANNGLLHDVATALSMTTCPPKALGASASASQSLARHPSLSGRRQESIRVDVCQRRLSRQILCLDDGVDRALHACRHEGAKTVLLHVRRDDKVKCDLQTQEFEFGLELILDGIDLARSSD